MPDLDYDTRPDPAFEPGVRRFPWQEWRVGTQKVGWVAPGPCPRCGHTMAVYRRLVRGARPSATITAQCNCVEHHGGRPDGVSQGCGQSALVDLSVWDPAFRPGSPG